VSAAVAGFGTTSSAENVMKTRQSYALLIFAMFVSVQMFSAFANLGSISAATLR